MDLKVRNVPKKIVAYIDEKAKAKKVSREEFLREQLRLIALDDEIKTIKEQEELMMNNLIKVIQLNTKVMKVFLKNNCLSIEEVLEDE
ncbi:MAG: hypothetical protein E7A11_16930 [Clostridium sp.]|uniref:hypothetical protein n=1 Tax=Clostridium TaxID=1485 RepID=UPI000C0696AC|nr:MULTISPECIES: hypothetical protein [Clostridium]MDB2104950.1 hypothetical protein [Clostridium paraputrificum]MDU1034190.1 hypothetical protein [Clostridium sp.]MDU1077205.1 hypothetical protein [Clostridium sp.]MDU1126942.1 hypothetical protein [Clostridium sp.]MDU2108855.1 hypothetical protein [Clostridium sp.]